VNEFQKLISVYEMNNVQSKFVNQQFSSYPSNVGSYVSFILTRIHVKYLLMRNT